jgi:hypothetical protein
MTWEAVGSLKGPKGDKGDSGTPGAPGEPGAPGDDKIVVSSTPPADTTKLWYDTSTVIPE